MIDGFAKSYWSPQAPLYAANLHVHCPENTAVTLTTTTGSAGFTVSIQYQIEEA